jgi:hypothetical protein
VADSVEFLDSPGAREGDGGEDRELVGVGVEEDLVF